MTIPLNTLPAGCRGHVRSLGAPNPLRRRLLDLGLVPGTSVERVFAGPGGDPICYNVRGAMIALRNSDAAQILVEA